MIWLETVSTYRSLCFRIDSVSTHHYICFRTELTEIICMEGKQLTANAF